METAIFSVRGEVNRRQRDTHYQAVEEVHRAWEAKRRAFVAILDEEALPSVRAQLLGLLNDFGHELTAVAANGPSQLWEGEGKFVVRRTLEGVYRFDYLI